MGSRLPSGSRSFSRTRPARARGLQRGCKGGPLPRVLLAGLATLYTSLFRYDDEIMANPHAYGEPASANPTLHLRRLDGGQIAEHYLGCFERVWDTAKPWYGEEV
jgi:hypothetical protein